MFDGPSKAVLARDSLAVRRQSRTLHNIDRNPGRECRRKLFQKAAAGAALFGEYRLGAEPLYQGRLVFFLIIYQPTKS